MSLFMVSFHFLYLLFSGPVLLLGLLISDTQLIMIVESCQIRETYESK